MRQLMFPMRQLASLLIASRSSLLYHVVCTEMPHEKRMQICRAFLAKPKSARKTDHREAILKIEINIDEAITDMEVVVTCSKLTPKVEKILAALRMMDCQLTERKAMKFIYWISRRLFMSKAWSESVLSTPRTTFTNPTSRFTNWNGSLQNTVFPRQQILSDSSAEHSIIESGYQQANPHHHGKRRADHRLEAIRRRLKKEIGGEINGTE